MYVYVVLIDRGPGEVAILKQNDRFIYYLVTKKRYFEKPTYESMKSSLQNMKTHSLNHNVNHIAMPRIGSGLDQLNWQKVAQIIEEVFSDSNINISVYRLS